MTTLYNIAIGEQVVIDNLVTPGNHVATADDPAVVFSREVKDDALAPRTVLVTLDRMGIMNEHDTFENTAQVTRNHFQLTLSTDPQLVNQEALWRLHDKAVKALGKKAWKFMEAQRYVEKLQNQALLVVAAEYSVVKA